MGACLSLGKSANQQKYKAVEETQVVLTSSEPSSVSETAHSTEKIEASEKANRKHSAAVPATTSAQENKSNSGESTLHNVRSKTEETNGAAVDRTGVKVAAQSGVMEEAGVKAAKAAGGDDPTKLSDSNGEKPRQRSSSKGKSSSRAHYTGSSAIPESHQDPNLILWEDSDQPDGFNILEQIHANSIQVQEEDVYVLDMDATQPEIVM
ncbi:hypothetical protein FVE85_2921 [Porphyridium purpureum]|uniref:Uncharacterized protein n=1 Tax=Porphyridium purpureum TaxID=35688 RepID=A0A5J4YUQ6_PORPP|nr:hypothetical protein FVE85_2921 [Porphyridium purpureum]|eukprot:POR0631..scf227_4